MTDGRLILGDCCDVLPTLPSASVDCVITDPPYPCIKREYGTWTEAEWFALMRVVVPECMRVLKPRGSAVFILQPNSERVGRMRTWLWEFLAWVGREFGIVQDAYWWNVAAMPNKHADRTVGLMRPSLKSCVWAGPADCYRDQEAVLWQESARNAVRRATERFSRQTYPSGYSNDSGIFAAAVSRGGVTPFNVLPFPNANSVTSAGADGHGAGTPEPLCDWWLRYLCPPGGTVLDPFVGSGTTAVAAVKRGCEFVGIERVPKYHEIAERRVREATAEHPLFAAPAAGGA